MKTQLRLFLRLCAAGLPALGFMLIAPTVATATPTPVSANIFIANGSGTIGITAYDFNGTPSNQLDSYWLPNAWGQQGLAISGTTLYSADLPWGHLEAYNVSTGTPVLPENNPYLITGLASPYGLAASGNNLYVTSFNSPGTVAAYNGTTGAALGGFTTITDLPNPAGLAVSGNALFVSYVSTDGNGDRVAAYDATTGSVLAGFTTIAGLHGPVGLAVSGDNLYVANQFNGTIGVYSAATGSVINTAYISIMDGESVGNPTGLAVSGNTLFVTDQADATLKTYDLSTGYLINGSLVSGLVAPYGIAIYGTASAVPEPAAYALFAGAAMLGLAVWRRRKSVTAAATV